MKISIKQLRNIIREELLKESFWSTDSDEYNVDDYNEKGVHKKDEKTLENLPNDLPDDSPFFE